MVTAVLISRLPPPMPRPARNPKTVPIRTAVTIDNGLLKDTSLPIIVLEEGIQAGGFGMLLREALISRGYNNPVEIVAIEDPFAASEAERSIRATMGIDANAVVTKAKKLLN